MVPVPCQTDIPFETLRVVNVRKLNPRKVAQMMNVGILLKPSLENDILLAFITYNMPTQ